MSQPRVHTTLAQLFEHRDPEHLKACLEHSDYQSFLGHHGLKKLTPVSLVVALTHTSFSHEYEVAHQELAEFLGDSVLQLIITDELFRRFPTADEGILSKLRSSIVNEKSLAKLGSGLGLSELILVGKGEFKKQLHLQDSTLADSMEALICQIYRIEGYEKARELVLGWIARIQPTIFDLNNLQDFDSKSKLQEATLAKYRTLPKYTSEDRPGGFQVRVWINEKLTAEGFFASKKSGERELAQKVLKEQLF